MKKKEFKRTILIPIKSTYGCLSVIRIKRIFHINSSFVQCRRKFIYRIFFHAPSRPSVLHYNCTNPYKVYGNALFEIYRDDIKELKSRYCLESVALKNVSFYTTLSQTVMSKKFTVQPTFSYTAIILLNIYTAILPTRYSKKILKVKAGKRVVAYYIIVKAGEIKQRVCTRNGFSYCNFTLFFFL